MYEKFTEERGCRGRETAFQSGFSPPAKKQLLLKRSEEVHAAGDFFDAGGLESFAFDDHAHAEFDGFCADSRDGGFAFTECFAVFVLGAVLEVDDVDAVFEAGDGFDRVAAGYECPVGVDFEVDVGAFFHFFVGYLAVFVGSEFTVVVVVGEGDAFSGEHGLVFVEFFDG